MAENWEVTTANDPVAGLELASKGNFEVILVDWKMPGLDGMDVLAELQTRAPDATVVMFSGYPSVERATEAMKRGAMDYVPKPFRPEEIITIVNRAMHRKVDQQKKTLEDITKTIGRFPIPASDDKAPKTIAETLAHNVGISKVSSPWKTIFLLGILAGAYIGFGGLLAFSVNFDMAAHMGAGFTKFMTGAVFSLGLMLVVIAGAELFTGNNLMVSTVLEGRTSWRAVLVRWVLVYGANFIGSILIVLLFYFSGLWKTGGGALGEVAVKTAYAKVALSWGEAFFRAIGCNWLVCLAVWMALAARQTVGKIFAIFFPIMGFVAIGFEHCVANMFFIPGGIILHTWAGIAAPANVDPALLNWGSFVWNNLIPVTIGNIIGGTVFVGFSYWSVYLRKLPQKDEGVLHTA
jgi:formate/nitrite transporter